MKTVLEKKKQVAAFQGNPFLVDNFFFYSFSAAPNPNTRPLEALNGDDAPQNQFVLRFENGDSGGNNGRA